MRCGDQLGMLHVVRGRVEHSRHEHHVVGQLRVAPDGPFVLVTRIGGLEHERTGLRLLHDRHDPFERNVVVVRPLVVAPADVHAHLCGRNVGERVVERLDVCAATLRNSSSLRSWKPVWRDIARSGQSTCSTKSGRGDGLVFRPHRFGNRLRCRPRGWGNAIGKERCDDAGRSGIEEALDRRICRECGAEVGDVGVHGLRVLERDRADAAHPLERLCAHERRHSPAEFADGRPGRGSAWA